MIARQGLKHSMKRKGNCFDNAAFKSFFGTLKAKFFHLAKSDSLEQLEAGMHDQPSGVPAEKYGLNSGISTLQLLGGNSKLGRFNRCFSN